MKERAIIEQLLMPLVADAPFALGLQDDAAVIELNTLDKGKHLVITTDMLQEGIHFLESGNPQDIAWKCLMVNLSDLAAMGAMPHSYQLALGLTHRQDNQWLEQFCSALADIHQYYGIRLSGGDIIRGSAALTISITAHGFATKPLLRTGAKAGDMLCITGTIGDAGLALACLTGQYLPEELEMDYLYSRYWRPTPRLETGRQLALIASAAMDISDGLIVDCQKLCKASAVGAALYEQQLPLSASMEKLRQQDHPRFLEFFSSGDDYELLFTIPPDIDIADLKQQISANVTVIGVINNSREVHLLNSCGEIVNISHKGYEH